MRSLSQRLEQVKRNRDPEYAKRKEEEEKRKAEERQRIEQERIRKEGEVKALFDEIKVNGKKYYVARVQQLLEFLKLKKNAITFWENSHIRKLYNVSSQVNFLCSIYTEEIEDETHQRWIRNNFANPFNDQYVVNCACIFRTTRGDRHHLLPIHLNGIFSSCEGTCYVTDSWLTENYDESISDFYVRSKFMKPKKYGDLLDKNVTVSRLARSNNEETVYILNPLFITENNFMRLDAYDVWKNSLRDEWARIKENAPEMIEILNALVRTRKIYLKEIKKGEA